MDDELTTLIAKPRGFSRVQRWPGAVLLALGLWSFVFGFEPSSLVFVAVGFWGTAEFWRGLRVTGDRLIAQGRVSRRTLPLAEVRQVGWSPSRTIWVQPRKGRTLLLHMAESRIDQPGRELEIIERLRELATGAGAELGPELDDAQRPPRPTTPFFGW